MPTFSSQVFTGFAAWYKGNQRGRAKATRRLEADADSPFWLGWCRSVCQLLPFFLLLIAPGFLGAAEPGTARIQGALQLADAEPHEPHPLFRAQTPREALDGQAVNGGGEEKPERWSPWSNAGIAVGNPADAPILPIFESDDPDSLFCRKRPNLLNRPIADEWDFSNLIGTDRPDFTDSPFSVGKGVTVWESGYTFRQIHDAETHLNRRTVPEMLLRYGLTDEFELRIRWNGYVILDEHHLPTGMSNTLFGGDDPILFFKWELLQQDVWRPMVTVLSGTSIPAGTRGVSANQLQPHINVVVGWGIRRWLYFKASTGVDWIKSTTPSLENPTSASPFFRMVRDNTNVYHNSASLLFQASQHVGGFVEWFSFASTGAQDNRAVHYFDTGLYFYVTPNVQLDVRIGKRLSTEVNEVITGTGFSVRY
jgi:hypothetical protein